LIEKVIVARERLALGNNFSLFMRIIHDTYRYAAYVKKTSGMFFHANPKGGTHGWVESKSFHWSDQGFL